MPQNQSTRRWTSSRGDYEEVPVPAPDADTELTKLVRAFIYWMAANEFTDPEHIFVCAEWHGLCEAVGEPMRMAGEIYRQRNPGN